MIKWKHLCAFSGLIKVAEVYFNVMGRQETKKWVASVMGTDRGIFETEAEARAMCETAWSQWKTCAGLA